MFYNQDLTSFIRSSAQQAVLVLSKINIDLRSVIVTQAKVYFMRQSYVNALLIQSCETPSVTNRETHLQKLDAFCDQKAFSECAHLLNILAKRVKIANGPITASAVLYEINTRRRRRW